MMRLLITMILALTPMHAIASGGGHFELTPFLGFVLNFVLLFGGTGFLLRKKISGFFETRAQRIAEDLEEAKSLQDEANTLIANTEAKLASLKEEQAQILERFRQDGESEKARLIQEATSETERIRKEAEFRLNQEVEQAKKRLLEEAVPMIIEMAEASVVQRLDKPLKDQLIEDGIARLKTISSEQLVQ